MARKSLEQMIAQEMGRDACKLFTTDEEFKKAKSFEDFCVLIKKHSKGKIQTTLPTVQKMVMGWISSNKCKVSDFEDQLKASKEKSGRKGKISFRETLETHFKQNIWEYFQKNLKGCNSMSSALAVISRESNGKVKTSEVTLRKTIESGLEAEEFKTDVPWIKWLPKKRKHRSAEEKAKGANEETDNVVCGVGTCKKCGWHGKRATTIFNKYCNTTLKAQRCPKCQEWATIVLTVEIHGKKVNLTSTIDENGCVGEDFVDDDWNVVPNPFLPEPSKEEKKEMKKRKAVW